MNQLLVKRTEAELPRWQIQIQIQAFIETQGKGRHGLLACLMRSKKNASLMNDGGCHGRNRDVGETSAVGLWGCFMRTARCEDSVKLESALKLQNLWRTGSFLVVDLSFGEG